MIIQKISQTIWTILLAVCLLACVTTQAAESEVTERGIPAVQLNNGYEMPQLGLGTWRLTPEEAENSTYHALKYGARLIDTARYYGTEAAVGRAVRRAIEEGICTREEVYITTKISPGQGWDYAEMIREANETIGLGYIDMMMVHHSVPGEFELYRAIEDAIDEGIVRSLAISNYYTPEEYDRITEGARYLPAVIQNENHPYYQNTALKEYVAKDGVILESYYPLGGRGHTQDFFENPVIAALSQKYGKSPAQILLRWHIQAGYIAIPGSSNPEHIAENLDIFDFELTQEEMDSIYDMNTGIRYETW